MILKLLNKMLFLLLFVLLVLPAKAQISEDPQSFNVVIPKAIVIDGVGLSPQTQIFGLPSSQKPEFTYMVISSATNDTWELTTNHPIGISISYNSGGSILAVFVSMTRVEDGYIIPQNQIRIYPSKVLFSTPAGGGASKRIFHFSPIIRVSKDTPPGNYIATIKFTVLGQ
ncbi:MAG: hypothetical protein AB1782_18240 [Cyanobacteriota bacterium]